MNSDDFLLYILFILFIQGLVYRCSKKSENYFCHILFILIIVLFDRNLKMSEDEINVQILKPKWFKK